MHQADQPETRRLYRTVCRWWNEIEVLITTGATTAKVEANNTAIKPIKRTGRGYRNLRTGEGWLYLATVIDLCTGTVIGWSTADHMRASLCTAALTMARGHGYLADDTTGDEVVFHSDRGSQYTSEEFQRWCVGNKIMQSMGAVGVSDNAMAESFFSALKNERVYRTVYATRAQARQDVITYIEGLYNSRRRHSALNYRYPNDVHYSYQQPALAA